jgi:hypothetical protein
MKELRLPRAGGGRGKDDNSARAFATKTAFRGSLSKAHTVTYRAKAVACMKLSRVWDRDRFSYRGELGNLEMRRITARTLVHGCPRFSIRHHPPQLDHSLFHFQEFTREVGFDLKQALVAVMR